MKKILSLILALAMVAALAACGGNGGGSANANKPALTDSLEDIVTKIFEEKPVEFAHETINVDLTDTSESGVYVVKTYSGLDNADDITEMTTASPMIGSIPFTMTLVRVKDASNAKAVAEKMKAGIDPNRWICVSTDEMVVSGYGDVVLLVATFHEQSVHAQDFTDAFQKICGADLDFSLT